MFLLHLTDFNDDKIKKIKNWFKNINFFSFQKDIKSLLQI